jgi:hypothetical protein
MFRERKRIKIRGIIARHVWMNIYPTTTRKIRTIRTLRTLS